MRSSPSSLLLALFFLAVYSVEMHAQTSGPSPSEISAQLSTTEAIRKGEINKVLSAMEVAALEAEKNRNEYDAAVSYRWASYAARVGGQLQKSISYGRKAFEMAEVAREPRLQASAILELADTHKQLGQYAGAREWLQRGIEVVKRVPSGSAKIVLEASMYRTLGTDFLRSGESQKAIDHISYSLQVLDSHISYLKRVRASAELIKNNQGRIITTLVELGGAYYLAGNFEAAIGTYEKGAGMIKEAGLKTPLEGSLYLRMGQAFLGGKDFLRARASLNKALEIGEKVQDASVMWQASSQIGDLLRQTRQSSEAIPHYKKAIDNIESMRSLLQSEEFRSSFFEDKRQTYSGMILASLDNNDTAAAFSYGERARSRAFLDLLGSKVQLGRGSLLEEERALQARLSELRAKMIVEQEVEGGDLSRERLQRDLEGAQRAYGEFLAKVRKENKEEASLMNVEPLTLKQTQELLEPGVTMLEYFATEREVLLWVVEKNRLEFLRVAIGRKELVSKVSALRDSVFQLGEKERLRTSSEELYKLLIQPALPHVHGKDLLVIPHDVLHYLPFQALLSSEGKYLIQDYPIYYLSSASLMQFTHEKRRAASGEQALVMGNPSLGDEAYNLRFAEREAKEVANVYPKSAVYLRAEASKSRAISLSPKYDMLHFAVHAELNEEDPMSSALLLAPEGSGDGRLKVGEIFSLNLKANMVVLSACETGLGKLSNGDELIGLTRAFIYAGTPSIITTLWKVNDRASYELMREFYQHLKTGKKSEALRQAQLKTMKEFPEPFYWAAYQLTGEP